jgi:pimeloyl-ACP methyl ester carboxylesterase
VWLLSRYLAGMELTTSVVTADGLDFTCLTAGTEGPLALCLHGFPDTAHGWRYLLPALAGAGYRAVAPFMRGYAPTSIPIDDEYHVAALAHDAVALHDALGGDCDAVLIGHDWGALATYGAASFAPDRWRRIVTAAVPPAAAMANAMTTYEQLKRSWYMFFFQVGLADFVVGMNELEFIASLWADWSPGYDPTVDMTHVRDALGDPANLAAALGYYRATWGNEPVQSHYQPVQDAMATPHTQPTLYLHGRNDGCVGSVYAENVANELPVGSSSVILDDCGHFLQVERSGEFNRLVLDFLG